MGEARAPHDAPSEVSADPIACIRRGAQGEYDDACATLYRTREGADEEQIRKWQDAEARAERHEALLNLLGPEDVDIAPTIDVTGSHSHALRAALARCARDFPGDHLRDQITTLRLAAGESKKGLRARQRRRHAA